MKPKGGARPGAGRPRRAEKYAGPIAAAEDRIADRLPTLVERLFERAEGIFVEREIFGGKARVYREPPCFKSLEYLLNRLMGRPTERHEVTGEGGGPIAVDLSLLPTDDLDRLRDLAAKLAGVGPGGGPA
jgi:hypothetical protein